MPIVHFLILNTAFPRAQHYVPFNIMYSYLLYFLEDFESDFDAKQAK